MENPNDGFQKEPEFNLDPTEKKTGETKKRALTILGMAALGAFLGDTFMGREHVVEGHDTNTYGFPYYTEKIDFTGTGRDKGGIFDLFGDDKTHMYTLDNNWSYSLYGYSEGYQYPIHLNKTDLDWYTSGFDTFNESVTYDGALYGTLGGLGSGFAANWMKRKLDKKKDDNTY